MLNTSDVIFYFLSILILFSGLGVIFFKNPIYSVLSLVFSMISIAGIFLHLGAFFLAGVQVIVYAGAVVVLFVMVVMLFDLKKEQNSFTRGFWGGAVKIISSGILVGVVLAAAEMSLDLAEMNLNKEIPSSTVELAELLFSKNLFVFELVSVLILVVLVGVVSLAKGEGGTHA